MKIVHIASEDCPTLSLVVRLLAAVVVSLAASSDHAVHAVQGPTSVASGDARRDGRHEGASAEVSTEELERILASRSATVLDARPYLEFAISHIPGALNVAPKTTDACRWKTTTPGSSCSPPTQPPRDPWRKR